MLLWRKLPKIVELIRKNPSITTEDIATVIGITVKGIEYHLAKMQEDKKLIREDSKKSGRWRLI